MVVIQVTDKYWHPAPGFCVRIDSIMVQGSANGHCTASQDSDKRANWTTVYCVYEPTKNFIINFLFLTAWKLLKIILKYPCLCLTQSSTPKCYFFAGRHFFIRKMKIKMADRTKHVLSKVEKNISFQSKTLLAMFYRQNKTFWYQFCNFKHFLKAENSEDSLASSCEEFCISFRVTQYETGLLLELGSR